MNGIAYRLEPEDWVLLGYLLGIGVWYLFEKTSESSTTSTSTWTEQEVTLTEDHLQRIEQGEPVRVARWHGHDLVLDGALVVDAEGGADE